jgi:uncharacterized repeat protein (TIGR03803 family)
MRVVSLMLGLVRLLALAAAPFAAVAGSALAAGYQESVLYGFCDQCSQGYEPRSWLYQEPSGNLFGTTFGGGHANGGTIYELSYNGQNQFSYSVLYDFCSKTDCTDGGGTTSGLIADQSGNLYGTTIVGGAHANGTIYELSYNQTNGTWTHTVLYSFCAKTNCPDGSTPYAGLTVDDSGNFYGTTYIGGAHNDGTVYELQFDQAKQKWVENVLYSFSCGPNSCPKGAMPVLGLYMDEFGNLFGSTSMGAHSGGNLFEMTFDQSKQKWVYSDIYDFCAKKGCDDGSSPSGRLVPDTSGNLYGTTGTGGAHGQGEVYVLTPAKKGWSLSILYSFCTGETCPDGQSPTGALHIDSGQNIFGTTGAGGANNSGTVYELSYNANTKTWSHGILYSFCAEENCTDGSIPTSGVIEDVNGNFYGTTEAGGVFGTAYELSPTR